MEDEFLTPDTRASFEAIEFVERIKKLVQAHDHPVRSLGNIYELSKAQETLDQISSGFEYYRAEKTFFHEKDYGPYTFRLVLDIRGGLVISCYFVEEGDKFLTPGHQFGVFEELNAEKITIPSYKSYKELTVILTEIKAIWDDFRDEFLRRKGIEIAPEDAASTPVNNGDDTPPPFMDVPFKPETLAVPFTPDVIENFDNLQTFQSDLETALEQRPGDVNVSIALAWVTMKIVEMGVHIDDLYEDTKRAVSLLDAVKTKAKKDGFLVAEFEMDLQALLARTKAFDDL